MDTEIDTARMFQDVVELNVGGKLMTTLRSTLRKEPDSMLASMFSGPNGISKDKDDRYFMDCDGEVFKYILDYLRFGKLPSQEMALDVYGLAKYLQIVPLAEKLEIFHSVKYQNQIFELRKQIDSQEYGNLKQIAINGIGDCNVGPQEDKALHFFYMGDRCGRCYSFKERLENFQTHDFTIYTNIFIDTENRTYQKEEIMRLLAYELYELGFAKYTINKKETVRCSSCNRERLIKQLILLTH